jgi:hypothetical protein
MGCKALWGRVTLRCKGSYSSLFLNKVIKVPTSPTQCTHPHRSGTVLAHGVSCGVFLHTQHSTPPTRYGPGCPLLQQPPHQLNHQAPGERHAHLHGRYRYHSVTICKFAGEQLPLQHHTCSRAQLSRLGWRSNDMSHTNTHHPHLGSGLQAGANGGCVKCVRVLHCVVRPGLQ